MIYAKIHSKDSQEFHDKEFVTLGDGKPVYSHGKGNVNLQMDQRKNKDTERHNLLYVPQLSCNVLSVGQATGKI